MQPRIVTQTPPSQPLSSHDELILVVKRAALFPQDNAWHGLKACDMAAFEKLVREQGEFLPRSLMEEDPQYKQIIPYLVFKHGNTYFLMERRADASEARLKSKLSLGIGGHVRQEDIHNNDLTDWARREFDEEVSFSGSYTLEPLGILNDDSSPVGQVHIGVVFVLHGDSGAIAIKDEHKSGSLVTLDECKLKYEFLESWSQCVVDLLAGRE